jgi:ribosome-binding protein aMBF1 (putative translation factor)
MQSGPIHQDWEPVVFKKKDKKQSSQQFNLPGTKKLRELEEDDVPKVQYVSKEQAQTIIEARNAKKITQNDLAKLCNLNVSIIKDFESQKVPFNKQLYSRLLNILGIKT